ncbi:MAG: 16S rRNA (adenine(1518)-N(6)/adenine(1519)-N(6))-dimethyltransferase RsmA [Candidatus Anstonellales archaeon]
MKTDKKPNKKLGQHFLIDKKVISSIANEIKGDIALEIGGGTGNLSAEVIKNVNVLYIIEKDKKLADYLKSKIPNAIIINEDFLKIKPFNVDVIFGNLPYYISSKILFRLYDWNFSYAILMFQKEFVEKMLAKPGNKNFGRLSFNAQNCYEIEKLFCIKNTAFRPVPKVMSCVVKIKKIEKRVKCDDKIIIRLFSQKNKKIKNIFKNVKFDSDNVSNFLSSIAEKRPWQLSFEEIKVLTEYLENLEKNGKAIN